MTDRPILFSAPMVLALLEGRKTMTRRLAWKYFHETTPSTWQKVRPGDWIWVREAFSGPYYLDDMPPRSWPYTMTPIWYLADGNPTDGDWTKGKPGIHMPRWASRLTLVVTSTKIERLQDINRGDAMAEGCPFPNMMAGPNPRDWFCDLWTKIHGPAAWQRNPEVVAIGFVVHERNIDKMGET